jgi:hypothetical protein
MHALGWNASAFSCCYLGNSAGMQDDGSMMILESCNPKHRHAWICSQNFGCLARHYVCFKLREWCLQEACTEQMNATQFEVGA